MRKKILLILLQALILLCSNAWADSFVVDGIKYYTNYSDPSTVYVGRNANSYNDPDAVLYSGDLVIPSTVRYQGVTYSVTSIEWYDAFSKSPDLKSITFPASAMGNTSINSSSFNGCTSLTHLNMVGESKSYFTYDGVLYYRNQGGYEGNTYIRDKWFSYLMLCPPGREGAVVICDTVTSLRYNGFPFNNCSKVTALKLSGESNLWAEEDGVIYSKDKTKVMMCPPGKSNVILPASVTDVSTYAFYNNRALMSIVLPDEVTNIGSYAFYNCSNLENINTPSSLTTIGSNAFYGCDKLTTVPLPEGTTSIPDYAYQGMKGLTNFVVPSTVTSIGKYAFSNCANLESITIPEGVTSIGEDCFSGCTSLKEIVLPSGVTVINNSVFSGCKLLESVNIPSGITSIGNSAFSGCESLSEINIPSGVKSIGSSAFSGCKILDAISLPSGITKINEYTFHECSSLKNVSIPASVTQIGNYAFWNCSGLTDIVIPSSVTSLGNSVFLDCSGLTDIVIPSSVTSLGNSVFLGCSNLENVSLQASITTIPMQSFSYCYKLRNLNIPKTVKTIGWYAFYGCNLSDIVIPASVTSIESDAFGENVKLYDVYNLSNLTITKGSTDNGSVGYYALAIHTSLDEPSAVSEQGDFLFATINGRPTLVDYKEKSTDVVLPDSYNGSHYDIGTLAFHNTPVTGITMSLAVDSICSNVFGGISKLQKVDVKDLAWWCSAADRFASNPLSVAKHLHLNGEEVIDLVIPSTVSYIGKSAFAYCQSIESVTIPSSVKKIGRDAFSGCEIRRLNIADLNSWLSIDLGSSTSCPGSSLYVDGKIVNDLVIPDGVTEIPQYAFYGKNIRSVVLPASVNSIGNYAFGGCSTLWEVYNLSSLDIKKGESKNGNVGYYAKAIYKSLDAERLIQEKDGFIFDISNAVPELIRYNGVQKDIVLPDKYNGKNYIIGHNAFSGNTVITSIAIPDGVTSIGNDAFHGCTNLQSVSIADAVESIGTYAFSTCTNLRSINLPKNIKTISNSMFYYCKNLTEIDIPEGVTSIGDEAFYRCTHLRDVHLPSTLTTIGGDAFYDCPGIKSIIIPASVTTISNRAFGGYQHITEIYNLSSVSIKKGSGMAIGAVAVHTSLDEPSIIEKQDGFMFVDWSTNKSGSYYMIGYDGKDTNIILPDTYKGQTYNINPYAFCGTPDITSITCRMATPPSQNIANPFYAVSTDIPVFVPAEYVAKYKNADKWKDFKNIGSLESRITSITLGDKNKQIKVGDTYTLSVTLSPEEPLISKLVWVSSDETVATVDMEGKITALSVGTATITATTTDGTKLSASCIVTVTANDNLEESTDISAYPIALYFNDVENRSGDFNLELNMKCAEENITAFQCDVYLPEGVEWKSTIDRRGNVVYDKPVFNEERTDESYHTIDVAKNDDGSYNIIVYSMDLANILETDGAIMTLPLTISEDMEKKDYNIFLKGIVLTDVNEQQTLIEKMVSKLTIPSYKPGDANGDGLINVTDVVSTIGYIRGKAGDNFMFSAADINEDNQINVTDIVGIIRLIRSSVRNLPAKLPHVHKVK